MSRVLSVWSCSCCRYLHVLAVLWFVSISRGLSLVWVYLSCTDYSQCELRTSPQTVRSWVFRRILSLIVQLEVWKKNFYYAGWLAGRSTSTNRLARVTSALFTLHWLPPRHAYTHTGGSSLHTTRPDKTEPNEYRGCYSTSTCSIWQRYILRLVYLTVIYSLAM